MSVNVTGPSIYFTIPVLGGIPITQTTLSSLLVTLILCCGFIWIGKGLKKRPDGKQVLAEKGIMMLYNMTEESMGKHNAESWFPFICTMFLSSILGSLIGMTGFLRSSTADVSTTLTWAIMVSVLIWYHNIKSNGFIGWLKGFTEPIVVMTPMNIVSEIAQPISMAFRHFGNVAGGSVLTALIYSALAALSNLLFSWLPEVIATVMPPIFQAGIPAFLSIYFDLFSGFVQALVFSLLTMVYVGGACPPPAEENPSAKAE